MLPGKRYKPEELLQIVRRRIWFLVIPWLLTVVATIVVAKLLPDRFRSESIILVVPPRVPDSIVKSAITAKIGDRLPSISQQILSRTRLELSTDQPGLQVYTGSQLDGTLPSANGGVHQQWAGVALEPELFPNTPNGPAADTAVIRPGKTYEAALEWRFSALGEDGLVTGED